jgi:hypothetical protein
VVENGRQNELQLTLCYVQTKDVIELAARLRKDEARNMAAGSATPTPPTIPGGMSRALGPVDNDGQRCGCYDDCRYRLASGDISLDDMFHSQLECTTECLEWCGRCWAA